MHDKYNLLLQNKKSVNNHFVHINDSMSFTYLLTYLQWNTSIRVSIRSGLLMSKFQVIERILPLISLVEEISGSPQFKFESLSLGTNSTIWFQRKITIVNIKKCRRRISVEWTTIKNGEYKLTQFACLKSELTGPYLTI